MSAPGDSRVLVTGAGGFVGRWLVSALPKHLGPNGVIVAAGRDLSAPAGIAALPLDITDRDAVSAAVRQVQPTCVVHLAAISSVQESDFGPHRTMEVNLIGTMNLAQAVTQFAPRARFVYAGTSEVYGATFRRSSAPLDETGALDPVNPYAASKAAADLVVGQMAHRGLAAIRFRPFNHTGPGQTETFAIPSFAAQIVQIERGAREPVLRVGDLSVSRDFLDVRDVVDAYIRAVLAPELPTGVVLNIASGTPRRLAHVLDLLLERSTARVSIEVDQARLRASDTPYAVGNADAARRLLGWSPSIPFEQTLDDVLAYWRAKL